MADFVETGTVGYPRVKYRKVVIPRADVRTLRGTPYQLVPSAGSFRVHLVHMVHIRKGSGTTYTVPTNADLVVRYTGGDGEDITQFSGSDFATTATRRRAAYAHSANSGDTDKDVRDNRGVEITLGGGTGEITGGATTTPLEVHVYYQTVIED